MLSALHLVDHSRYRKRPMDLVDRVVFHRSHLSETLEEDVEAFADTSPRAAGSYTGGKYPYHFKVGKLGHSVVVLPLHLSAPGAGSRYNKRSIHVAVHGDFRSHPPTDLQLKSCASLVVYLEGRLDRKLKVFGHTEMPGSSSDPDKQCPGPLFPLDLLRSMVDELS